jgi:glycosyltransferase involved in cell wall biosynthesis
LTLRESLLDPTFFAFNKLYSFIYRLNIQRNHFVVVQQKWIRKEFMQRYGASSVVVAHPVDSINGGAREPRSGNTTVFFFPALSRFFKNFEVICEAVALLTLKGITQFEVRLTIDGKENLYSAGLFKRFRTLGAIRFIGRQNQAQMVAQYAAADCLLFPSRLETWGLPITEAKGLQIPMLVVDLPYAHETVGTYDKVRFFPATDAVALAALMEEFIAGRLSFDHVVEIDPIAPFAKNWSELLKILTDGL